MSRRQTRKGFLKTKKNISLVREVRQRELQPLEVVVQALRSAKLRYLIGGTALIKQFQFQDIASQLGIIATAATTGVFLSSAIRLKEIEVWSPVTTMGVGVQAQLSWLSTAGDFESPPSTHQDSSVSFDRPAYLRHKPPSGSIASKWHLSNSTDLVVDLRAAAGSTIDFTVEFVISDSATILAQVASPAIAGATAGVIYHRQITGSTGSGTIQGSLNSIV
jgi:hypothetical protein